MKTVKKVMLLAILAVSVTSCAGIYRNLDIECEDGPRDKNSEGIHFDIDTNCDPN